MSGVEYPAADWKQCLETGNFRVTDDPDLYAYPSTDRSASDFSMSTD